MEVQICYYEQHNKHFYFWIMKVFGLESIHATCYGKLM
jgi:hypothetical protein